VAVNYELLSNLKKETYFSNLLEDLFRSIDLMNLPETLSYLNKRIVTILDNNPIVQEDILKAISDIISYKYFSKTSIINVVLEHEMQNRNLQVNLNFMIFLGIHA
jgi:hypothetical protein